MLCTYKIYTKSKQNSTTSACELHDPKFLVQNRTRSYLMQVSDATKIWYQSACHTSKVSGTSFWAENLGHVPFA